MHALIAITNNECNKRQTSIGLSIEWTADLPP